MIDRKGRRIFAPFIRYKHGLLDGDGTLFEAYFEVLLTFLVKFRNLNEKILVNALNYLKFFIHRKKGKINTLLLQITIGFENFLVKYRTLCFLNVLTYESF